MSVHRNVLRDKSTATFLSPPPMTSTTSDGSVMIDDRSAMNSSNADMDTVERRDHREQLCQLVYLSSSSGAYSKEDLVDILSSSRRNNTRDNITGLLLYHDGNVIQFLEGEEAQVQKLYNRIAGDRRHKGVLPLLTRKITSRDFGSWSMGFKNITEQEKDELEGFNDLMNSLSSHTVIDPSMSKPVQRLIRSYRQLWDSGRNSVPFSTQ